jgi:peptidoglycan/xylan/chitin deacetylase (PgdA/CDA1 family)
MTKRNILLSFDFEEFDVPREHGVDIPMDESMRVSHQGAVRVLDCLKAHGVKATFFCTANFAKMAPDVMLRIVEEGHEVASHGCDHWQPKESDVRESRRLLQELTGAKVTGYRQPRMFPVSCQTLLEAGYTYNSSLNPAFIPGRYMHLNAPRTPFRDNGLVQVPASVTPLVRFPLFWLSLHHLPQWLYRSLVLRTLRHDGLFVTYFHPWEFADDTTLPKYQLPFVVRRHCGEPMLQRLDRLIGSLKKQEATFLTFTEYINQNAMS